MRALTIVIWSVAVVCVTLQGTAETVCGDFVEYTFTGLLPPGSATHPLISDGETFAATFIVDRSVVDSDDRREIGYYEASVVFGTIEFSGGFVSENNYTGNRTIVFDDWQGADSVSVRGNGLIVQANNEDLSTINSDLLPDPGFGFVSAPDPSESDYFQLLYNDDVGTVLYIGSEAHNVAFQASAIPEPATAQLIASGVLCWLSRRRRS